MHNYIHFETITTHSRKSLSLNCHKDIILGFTLFSPFGAESLHAHEYAKYLYMNRFIWEYITSILIHTKIYCAYSLAMPGSSIITCGLFIN